jgi:hypothetical protein
LELKELQGKAEELGRALVPSGNASDGGENDSFVDQRLRYERERTRMEQVLKEGSDECEDGQQQGKIRRAGERRGETNR